MNEGGASLQKGAVATLYDAEFLQRWASVPTSTPEVVLIAELKRSLSVQSKNQPVFLVPGVRGRCLRRITWP